jgi:hypothetical protein
LSSLFSSLSDTSEPFFPGHKAIEGDLLEIDDVIIAAFTSLGLPEITAPGISHYEGADIDIAGSLKGKRSGTLKASYTVHFLPVTAPEVAPALGTRYIIFLRTVGVYEYQIDKLLPATDKNVTRIKALIASQTAD